MSLDIFILNKVHEEVREAIRDGKAGYAQGAQGDTKVSYIRDHFPGGLYHAPLFPQPSATQILVELMLDAARGEGEATSRVFERSDAEWAIKDRRRYPEHWLKKHVEADLLERLLADSPELFV